MGSMPSIALLQAGADLYLYTRYTENHVAFVRLLQNSGRLDGSVMCEPLWSVHGLLEFPLLPSCRGLQFTFRTDGHHSIFRLASHGECVVRWSLVRRVRLWPVQLLKGKEKSTGYR